jgi:hypothetical protein
MKKAKKQKKIRFWMVKLLIADLFTPLAKK